MLQYHDPSLSRYSTLLRRFQPYIFTCIICKWEVKKGITRHHGSYRKVRPIVQFSQRAPLMGTRKQTWQIAVSLRVRAIPSPGWFSENLECSKRTRKKLFFLGFQNWSINPTWNDSDFIILLSAYPELEESPSKSILLISYYRSSWSWYSTSPFS